MFNKVGGAQAEVTWKGSLVSAYHPAATRNPHGEMASRNTVLYEVALSLHRKC